eukprot:6714090-Pyramimonas_sp.AAC.1
MPATWWSSSAPLARPRVEPPAESDSAGELKVPPPSQTLCRGGRFFGTVFRVVRTGRLAGREPTPP